MNIHFVGSEGVSMRWLCKLMVSYGHTVTGSDIIKGGHNADNIRGADMVVYTTAVGEDNVEVIAAVEKGLPVLERAEFLGLVASEYKNVIAVAGSHGKTTATGFLEQIFSTYNPTVHIGGRVLGESGRVGGEDFFISEACEYKRSFLHIKPAAAIILNIELDHTDYYKNENDYFSAFWQFTQKAKFVIVNGDDPKARKLSGLNGCTFGLKNHNTIRAVNIVRTEKGHSFDILEKGKKLLEAEICLKGEHNIYNALSATAAARCFDVPLEIIKAGLKAFYGVQRRFEYIGDCGPAKVYSDYAHHPSEIKAALKSARETGSKKTTIVFEPHTYSRTQSLEKGFVESLRGADRIVLAPIYPAREDPVEGVTSHNIVRRLIQLGAHAVHFDTFGQIASYLRNTAQDNEIIVFAGAGTIDKAAKILVAGLNNA